MIIVFHTEGYVMTLTEGLICKVKVSITVYTKLKSLSGPYLLTTKLDLYNISNNSCPCPKDVLWSWPKAICLGQGQGHSTHIALIYVWAITSYCQVGSCTSHNCCLWPKGVPQILSTERKLYIKAGRQISLLSFALCNKHCKLLYYTSC